MAFDGMWKVDRSENYDKFMEKMGKGSASRGCCFCFCFLPPWKLRRGSCESSEGQASRRQEGPRSASAGTDSQGPRRRGSCTHASWTKPTSVKTDHFGLVLLLRK